MSVSIKFNASSLHLRGRSPSRKGEVFTANTRKEFEAPLFQRVVRYCDEEILDKHTGQKVVIAEVVAGSLDEFLDAPERSEEDASDDSDEPKKKKGKSKKRRDDDDEEDA